MTHNAENDAPDAYMAPDGRIWLNRRKHADLGGVFDATPTSTPLWLGPIPPAEKDVPVYCWCRPGSPELPVSSPHFKSDRCTPIPTVERATGAVVPERQRCICNDGLCLDHCRACNHSGRDLEEPCIADPDWEPDEDDLARRESGVIPPEQREATA